MDKIPHLPEHLQHRILDFLEQEEVGRAAVLSKAWRSIVESYPALLSFTQTHFKQTYAKVLGLDDATVLGLDDDDMSHLPGHRSFSNLIDQSFRNKSAVQKFSLRLWSCHRRHAHWQSQLDSWVQHLAELGGLKELTLCLYNESELYTLPPSALCLCSKTLTKLALSSSFNVDVKHCNRVRLPNLLELKLDISDRNRDMFNIFMSCYPKLLQLNLTISNLNQDMFKNFVCGCPNLLELYLRTSKSNFNEDMCKNLTSSCPNLEILDIYPRGVSSICVTGLTRLHRVYIDGDRFTRVKIVAPRLRIFEFSPSNGCSTEIDLSACESTLKVLSLIGLRLTKETLSSCVSKFPELETLVLQWLNVDGIEIPNKKIRKLEVANCYELEKFEIGASHLEFLSFHGMFTRTVRDVSPCWINTFKECYPNLARFKDIKLTILHNGKLIICEVLDERFIEMLYKMEQNHSRLEVLRAESRERVLDRIFTGLVFSIKIDYISILSTDHQSHELYLQALKNMTVKENMEPNCWRKGNNSKGEHVLHHVKLIPPTKIPYYLESYNTTECKITRIRLHWIPTIDRRT